MTKKESNTTLSKATILEFNNVFGQVKGLAQQTYIDFLTLKVKLSGLVEQIDKARTDAIKAVLKELGFNDGESIPTEKQAEVNVKLTGVITNLFSEEIELDTKVLSTDEFFNSILSIDENNTLSTEHKAILMKYLVK